jgi:xylulose-5-phosphate/fructose-6-phosphate phosphoketolase
MFPVPGTAVRLWWQHLSGRHLQRVYPDITQDEFGLKKLFTQFSFPGGIPSHVSPEVPGLYPRRRRTRLFAQPCLRSRVRQSRAGCGLRGRRWRGGNRPAGHGWHSNKFLNPATDGVVLPILHLNGYKIANPTVLARIEPEELEQLLRGYGWTPYFVEGDEPERCIGSWPPRSNRRLS